VLPPFHNSYHFGQHVTTKKELQKDVLTTSFPERREYRLATEYDSEKNKRESREKQEIRGRTEKI
jgi:hypothetical protein